MRVDYLAIGHITKDLTATGSVIGGTVAYSGRTAQRLGCHTAVLTSAQHDYDWHTALPNIQVKHIPAEHTSTFSNIYTENGRQQIIHAVAAPLTAADVPADWQRAPIVHLAPLTNEVEPEMIHLFSNSLVGLTPQGWLRHWDENGRVTPQPWPAAAHILPLAAAVIISEEDLLEDNMLAQYRAWSHLLIMTQGASGCTIFMGDDARHVPAPAVPEVEPTGAGDIFATAFLLRLEQTNGNPWEAARFANQIAAQSVTQVGLDAKLDAIATLIP
jgi:sugar/nucleoside kinase (ribokinase family)